jgi:TRAP-type transport system periplasmic protein
VVGRGDDPYGRRMTRIPLIFLLAVGLLVGCDSDNSDRAGGDTPVKPKVLVMANANGELGELEAFDEAVKRVSGGHLRIKWLNEYGKGGGGNAEINLIRDVNAGKADLGWAGTRVFDELGDPAFNPLHAPLLIDSYDLEEKVLSDDVVAPMLKSLDDLELQGIGVLPARCVGRSASTRCVVPTTGPAPESATAAATRSRGRCARLERRWPRV